MKKSTYKFGLKMIDAFYKKVKIDFERAIFNSDVDQWWIKNACTKTFLNKFETGKISAEELKAHAKKRRFVQLDKDRLNEIAKLDNMMSADKLTKVNIDVEWIRSKTWGHNPEAYVVINDRQIFKSRRVGGYGYDKRSAATAEALNNSLEVMAALLELARKEAKRGNKTYGYFNRGALPYFESGVGFECHRNILVAMGLKTVQYNERCATHDHYLFVKGK